MRVLVIGGTSFLGRHITERAVDEGHTVTLFNRGQTNPLAFPGVEHIRGDRNDDLSGLADREWDATIDVCAYVPVQVRKLLDTLGEGAGVYTFISSVSVYDHAVAAGFDETAPVVVPSFDEHFTMRKYGELKVGCEIAARELVGDDRLCLVRPGYIVGAYDPTNRFAYWVERIAAGGRMLGPDADQPMQMIDGRDVAAFIVGVVEHQTADVFSVTAPDPPVTFAEMFDQIAEGIGVASPDVAWRGADSFLPFSDGRESWGMMAASVDKAKHHGLTWRPLPETAHDTLEWLTAAREAGTYLARPESVLSPEKEAEILARP